MTLADTSTKRPQSFQRAAITAVWKIILISKDGPSVSEQRFRLVLLKGRLGPASCGLTLRRVAYRHRPPHIVPWELILEPQCRLQRISKTAIAGFCMSVDLNDKKLMGHGVTDTDGLHSAPLSIARGCRLDNSDREPFPTS